MENKIKNWEARYFRGGYLAKSCLMSKESANNFMIQHVDGHYIEKVKGFFKGKRIYKYPQEKINA